MISLEQIRTLEAKVNAAVQRIKSLTAENARLKESLQGYEARIAELQRAVEEFKEGQEQIEAGIVTALKHLDELEDDMSAPVSSPSETFDSGPAESVSLPSDDDETEVDDMEVSIDDPAAAAIADDPAPAEEQQSDEETSDNASAEAEQEAGSPPDSEGTGSEPNDDQSDEEGEEEPELDIF